MVGLTVYEDLINYSTGDYKRTSGKIVGGHAVKMIGWRTTSSGKTSWLIQNQWNTDWGENGYGYILEGEVGIDSIGISC
jgi:cathepsin B